MGGGFVISGLATLLLCRPRPLINPAARKPPSRHAEEISHRLTVVSADHTDRLCRVLEMYRRVAETLIKIANSKQE